MPVANRFSDSTLFRINRDVQYRCLYYAIVVPVSWAILSLTAMLDECILINSPFYVHKLSSLVGEK